MSNFFFNILFNGDHDPTKMYCILDQHQVHSPKTLKRHVLKIKVK